MSGKSSKTTPVSFRLPNDVVSTLDRRINGRRSTWQSRGEYCQDVMIWYLTRSHERSKGVTRGNDNR